ncbi:metallophosphoesterase [Hymenobacter arizonensis]|uniref:Calcineurin-like phosphoesterase n=1 Tax=Hymenobacter arizonensis TaxID=1227077 RepID=A0A1I5YXD7_HYMAR|nr:metallophosphoesterase [Hymenobacter arizonensis]SFQ48921.1 Calcineurin-like phosphoesterase [Hymenobacter arizonensis]
MRVFVVPDVHGRTCWQAPAQHFLDTHSPADHVVFLGDYVDSFEVSNEQQLNTFTDIIAFKKANPDRVILLLGNHCFQYLYLSVVKCFGFNEDLYPALHLLYKLHIDYFQVAYQRGQTLFVHAGISQAWLTLHAEKISQRQQALEATAQPALLADVLNSLLRSPGGPALLWEVGPEHGGSDPLDGPVWVRPAELKANLPPGLTQVVGHTPVAEITEVGDEATGARLILTDCLSKKVDFLTLAF